MEPVKQRCYPIEQCAALGFWKEATWRKKVLRREVPYLKIGRSIRIPADFIEKLLRDGRRDPIEVK